MADQSIEDKKKMLLAKYQAPKFNLIEYQKFAVYKKPLGQKDLFASELVTVCETEKQSIQEIAWRLEFIKTGNKDLLFKHDPRFKTFEDDSTSGKKFEDYVNLEFETPGEFFILPIYT